MSYLGQFAPASLKQHHRQSPGLCGPALSGAIRPGLIEALISHSYSCAETRYLGQFAPASLKPAPCHGVRIRDRGYLGQFAPASLKRGGIDPRDRIAAALSGAIRPGLIEARFRSFRRG